MNTIAKSLEHIEIMNDQGDSVTVGSAWSDGPALVVFIRHFG